MENNKEDSSNVIEKIFGDVNKLSAGKQIALGTASGWCTGFLGMKVGKLAALTVGGGIIFLQIAHHNGYIKINWNKVNNKFDKLTDKVEEQITGQPQNWMDKVEKFVDRKIDKAEDVLKSKQGKAKSWYNKVTGKNNFVLENVHIFLLSFAAGVAVGIASG